MSGDKKGFNRRDFMTGTAVLGASVLTPTPVERLAEVLTRGLISRAQAESIGIEGPRNYLNILMFGAPLRYCFDHWMRTKASDPALEFNPMVATKMVSSGGRVVGTENATFNYNGTLVPHMFSHSVYNGKGAQRPLTDLLNHMLVIRGFGTGFDGHAFNVIAQQSPVGGIATLSGVAADMSKKTFEAVQWPDRGSVSSYTSMNGKALNKLAGATPLKSLLEGFGSPQQGLVMGRNVKDRNRAAYDLAQARLKAYARSNYAGAKNLSLNMTNAVDLMKKGTNNIDSFWPAAVARYKSVIELSMRQSGLAGISDVPMISAQNELWKVHVAAGNRGLIVGANSDFRDAIKTMAAIDHLAEGLAMAEYVFRENLVTSLEISTGELSGLNILEQNVAQFVSHVGIKDMHETGAITGLLITAAYFRGLSAGILELMDQLKGIQTSTGTAWSDTVVQVISDFNRSARISGGGSDHGYNQMVTSVYTGAFDKGPYVVGNIHLSGHGGGYAGTQGIAAPISGYTQKRMPNPTMAASTVTALLRVNKNPFENLAAPLVRLENGRLVLASEASIVRG
ncbi:hypothetical protein [Bdellovibrio sp. HCB2-146]|uniref:hypothetical protein n=1 Tax=Bdellovibrio sp. HCB2-146 TaxID=3394362 RepID=UPI0039BC8701